MKKTSEELGLEKEKEIYENNNNKKRSKNKQSR